MEQVFTVLIDKGGLIGALLVASLFVIRSMWNQINDLQDKRLNEAMRNADAMNTNANAISSLTASVQALGELIKAKG